MIPKIIHQIWYQGWNKFPERLKVNVDSVSAMNPDWTRMTWDENSLRDAVASLGQKYLDKYDGFSIMHQKIDFGRYAVLYIYGGVSVDTDIFAFKGFDETPTIDTSDLIVSKNPTNSFLNNATILASKNNPIMLGLLDSIAPECKSKNSNFLCMQETTAPKSFTKYMNQFKDQITILDSSYFEPCSGADKFCEVKPNSILDHRHELSWLSPAQRKASEFYHSFNHKKSIVIPMVLLGVVVVLIVVNIFD